MANTDAAQRFPFVNLEKAIERARQIYEADQRGGDVSVGVAFTAWDYSDKSSGGFQTISGLKMYGLLVDSGANEARKIKLSKAGLDYFRDEREDARSSALRAFAFSPLLFKSLWQGWGPTPPPDAIARSHLKVDRGIGEQNARAILSIYKDNLAFANIKGNGNVTERQTVELPQVKTPQTIRVGDFVQWRSDEQDQFKSPRRVEWVAEDGSHLRVLGSLTGIPIGEVTVSDPPFQQTPDALGMPKTTAPKVSGQTDDNDINVLLKGDRLQISADIDAKGIKKLKRILDMHLSVMMEEDD